MDLLIKNMEMPQEGHIEAYIWCNGTVTYRKKIDNQWDRNSTTAVALPEHKKAYWRNAMCSNCGAVRLVSASGNFYFVNYCHNCGAEIVEATE